MCFSFNPSPLTVSQQEKQKLSAEMQKYHKQRLTVVKLNLSLHPPAPASATQQFTTFGK